MKREATNPFSSLTRYRILLAAIFLVILANLVLLVWPDNRGPERRLEVVPTPPVNALHGIHAPIGYHWTDADRQLLASFKDAEGFERGPGLITALSADLGVANNSAGRPMEADLFDYQQQGAQIYIRMYPQRFPGGPSDPPSSSFNTVSGTPEDAANDVFNLVSDQQKRTGHHFTLIIPGNEMNLEWPNGNYNQNLLPWASNDDPQKFVYINRFYTQIMDAWQARINTPEGSVFRDVKLVFPALGQDGSTDYFGGFYFYNASGPVTGDSKYERLREAVERYPVFSWHNYWRPGRAWEDRAIQHFPAWLKRSLDTGARPGVITESGWSPDSLKVERPARPDINPLLVWFYNPPLPLRTYDESLTTLNFEDELKYFIQSCSGAAYDTPKAAGGVAVWLASSGGNFQEAVGIDIKNQVRRWFKNYAGWRF